MKPYYDHNGITIYHGDCREILLSLPDVDCVVTDPPYNQTALAWDRWVSGWLEHLKSRSMWCFGTLRMFMERAADFSDTGWRLSQDIVWEKHNGSGLHNDRFRRVHEQAAHFYRNKWADVHKAPVYTMDAKARTVRRKARPAHWNGFRINTPYASKDGGPRLQRSVIKARSCHGDAYNETQKPVAIIHPLLDYSAPKGGIVLDPFAGSGSVGVAAQERGLRAILIDLREDQCEAMVDRLRQQSLLAVM